MELVIVRHGESVANADGIIQGRFDYELSEKGRDQALRTARALMDFSPYRIYTSPLDRARETADIINRRHNAEIVVLPDLIEYDLGGFEGLTMEQILEKFPEVPDNMKQGTPFHHLAPGAESDQDVDTRVARAQDEIVNCGLPRVVVVSHLGVLERIILKLGNHYGINDIAGLASWPLKNCSITRMAINPFESRFDFINDVSHL